MKRSNKSVNSIIKEPYEIMGIIRVTFYGSRSKLKKVQLLHPKKLGKNFYLKASHKIKYDDFVRNAIR